MFRKILLVLLILSCKVFTQRERVLIDENFADWQNVSFIHNDKIGDGTQGGIDFSELKLFNDEDYLYLMINCGFEFNLSNDNNFTLYIDTDSDPNTGFSFNGLGCELKYNFGNKEGWFYTGGDSISLKHIDIGLVVLPTVTSDKFEIAVDKKCEINGKKLFVGNQIKVAISDGTNGDVIPDNNGISYSFSSEELKPVPGYSIERAADSHFRIATYNIENDGFVKSDKKEYFSRIINAVDADIIAFQEFKSAKEAAVKTVIEEMTGKNWNVKKLGYDLVLATKFKITSYDEIETFETSSYTKLHSVFKLDLRPYYDTDLILFNMHPKCCSGSSEDYKREQEFDKVMSYLRDSKAGKTKISIFAETPIFVVGDMNLVGNRLQQVTLLTGDIIDNDKFGDDFNPDWDQTQLEDLKPLATGRTAAFTTYDKYGSYPPGRLDYITYTGSVLEKANSFVLFTLGLSQEELQKHNLQTNDVIETSDHLPVVADFRIKKFVSVLEPNELPEEYKLHQNYPNPFNPGTKICYNIPKKGLVKLKIYDILGRKLETLVDDYKESGNYQCYADFSKYPSGTYIYKLEVNDYSETRKMIHLK